MSSRSRAFLWDIELPRGELTRNHLFAAIRFIGRIPITAALKALSEDDLIRILKEPKFSLVQQYTDLFAASGVHLL